MVTFSPALWLAVAVIAALSVMSEGHDQKPNVIMMIAANMGNDDVQEFKLRHMTETAEEGRELKSHYSLPTGTPTRAAVLTGNYPFRYGMSVNNHHGAQKGGLDIHQTLLGERMQGIGYKTYYVGTWCLGFCDEKLTPTKRGFDKFFGSYTCHQGYFNHSGTHPFTYDLREGLKLASKDEYKRRYSTIIYTERVQNIIRDAKTGGSPFFIVLSYQNAAPPYEPYRHYIDKYCAEASTQARRVHCGNLAAMDEGIGNITRTLQNENLLDDTIKVIISSSGVPLYSGGSYGSLRGVKGGLWEGGTRTFAAVNYSKIIHRGRPHRSMFHVVDWTNTILQAVGEDKVTGLDSLGLWHELRNPEQEHGANQDHRGEFYYNIDGVHRRSAMRRGKWKLMSGKPSKNKNAWYDEKGRKTDKPDDANEMKEFELFDLSEDINEKENVYAEHADKPEIKRMLQDLRSMAREAVPPMEEDSSHEGIALAKKHMALTPGFCTVTKDEPDTKGEDDDSAKD